MNRPARADDLAARAARGAIRIGALRYLCIHAEPNRALRREQNALWRQRQRRQRRAFTRRQAALTRRPSGA